MSAASATPEPTKNEDWHEGFSAGWDSAQPHLRAGLIELRLDSLAPTQMANVRKHFDRLGVPYIVISSSELRIDYSALAASTPPATERTVLKGLRKMVEDAAFEDYDCFMVPTKVVTLSEAVRLIDAQERAGAKT